MVGEDKEQAAARGCEGEESGIESAGDEETGQQGAEDEKGGLEGKRATQSRGWGEEEVCCSVVLLTSTMLYAIDVWTGPRAVTIISRGGGGLVG